MPHLLNQTVWISFACHLLEAGGETASALPSVDQGKWDKHSITCKSHGFDFIPFDFFTFGSFVRVGEEVVFVSGTSVPYNSHAQIPQWETHALVFRRLSFADMRGVAEQFVGRQLVDLRR